MLDLEQMLEKQRIKELEDSLTDEERIAAEMLYDDRCLDIDIIGRDMYAGFLTDNIFKDGDMYLYYYDGVIEAAINVRTKNIIYTDEIEELFQY